MQQKAKEAMGRINDELDQAEDVAVKTKEQLVEQRQKLMIIDESLNKIDKTSVRLKGAVRRLRMGIQADKLHCFLSGCICLNLILLIILLFTTFGGDKRVQDIEVFGS